MVSVITLPLVVTRSWDELVDTRLQTSLLRALAPTTPTYVFPAMNTLMYEHPLTSQHVRIIKEVIGYQVVGPVGKSLACGDVGKVNFAKTCTTCLCSHRVRGNVRMDRHRSDRGGQIQSHPISISKSMRIIYSRFLRLLSFVQRRGCEPGRERFARPAKSVSKVPD